MASENDLTGSADGDSGEVENNPTPTSSSPAEKTNNDTALPGRRPKNPLGYLASYTYQISLYMITPQAYAQFVASGRRNVGKEGVYLIAQSGGINNDVIKRAAGFEYDYYIDNLRFTTMGYKNTGSPSFSTEFSFTITEPYGFSFVSNLRRAAEAINNSLGGANSSPENSTKQLFILGLRFSGYDSVGNLVSGTTNIDGKPIDPNASDDMNLFQRYFDIVITSLEFKIDGKATVYTVSANSFSPFQSFSVTRGIITKNFNAKSKNVGEVLRALIKDMNDQQAEIYKNSEPVTEYDIKFINDGSELIESAALVTPDDLLKFKWPGSPATDPAQSNLAVEIKAQPNNAERMISFKQDTPVLQAINQIISLSSYVKNSLEVLYSSELEPVNGEVPKAQVTAKNKTVRWFNCSAETKVLKWHTDAKDWKLLVTYLIQVYDTPMIDSALAVSGKSYYGPFKRYDYWYTGKNSEVIGYTQTLNNSYFTTVLSSVVSSGSTGGTNQSNDQAGSTAAKSPLGPTTAAGMKTQESSQATLGGTAQAVNNYTTSLFDPSSQVEAKIQILGDPDFLISDSSYSDNSLNNKFYGPDGYTVNPNGGQVFIEIDFKEAKDYSMNENDNPFGAQPGTLSINNDILFWKPTASESKSGPLAYQVVSVESSFSRGIFSQNLDTVMMPITDGSAPTQGNGRPAEGQGNVVSTSTNSGPVPGNSNIAMGNDNLKKDKPLDQANNISATSTTSSVIAPQTDEQIETITVTTRTGNVADDDGGIQ